ncbi:GTP-binding protein [Prochlorococcus sp. MIT 1307]|uniref:GTP-binding protein n=1 Tax=Prochlorococcus sp. MIT 1307 TaxID=3096219 RepID=UPI002A758973|nr:GTP-binding protein [Prochlorococcus sp. MIT 1307]
MSKRLPVTVITGFLGAGKTTLLRHLLTTSQQRLAVMVNEFGSVGLDGDLIRSCNFCSDEELDGRLVELNNGCLCCTVQDDFLPTMEKLLSLSRELDGILVETSGLALPLPLVQALDWPEIRAKVYLNGVVTIVDGEALAAGSPVGDTLALEKQRQNDPSLDHLTPVNELFDDQISSADFILISRFDLLEPIQYSNIKLELSKKSLNGTPVIGINNGKIDPSLILGIKSDQLCDVKKEPLEDHSHASHSHVQVFSSLIRVELLISQKQLQELLTSLAIKYQILRLKGRCWLPQKSIPLQLQMVGARFSSWFESVPENTWKPKVGGVELVVLSFDEFAEQAIKEALKDFGPAS